MVIKWCHFVTSLFTNVPLDETMEVILQRVYTDRHQYKYSNQKKKKERKKELLHLCTKNVHFIFHGEIYEIYIQINGVAMSSPLGPVLTNIFMVELENILILKLDKEVKLWRRFVNDTICFAKMD